MAEKDTLQLRISQEQIVFPKSHSEFRISRNRFRNFAFRKSHSNFCSNLIPFKISRKSYLTIRVYCKSQFTYSIQNFAQVCRNYSCKLKIGFPKLHFANLIRNFAQISICKFHSEFSANLSGLFCKSHLYIPGTRYDDVYTLADRSAKNGLQKAK